MITFNIKNEQLKNERLVPYGYTAIFDGKCRPFTLPVGNIPDV